MPRGSPAANTARYDARKRARHQLLRERGGCSAGTRGVDSSSSVPRVFDSVFLPAYQIRPRSRPCTKHTDTHYLSLSSRRSTFAYPASPGSPVDSLPGRCDRSAEAVELVESAITQRLKQGSIADASLTSVAAAGLRDSAFPTAEHSFDPV